jgi:hypothetical protein
MDALEANHEPVEEIRINEHGRIDAQGEDQSLGLPMDVPVSPDNLNASPSSPSESNFSHPYLENRPPFWREEDEDTFVLSFNNLTTITEADMQSSFGTPAYYKLLTEKHLDVASAFEKELMLDLGDEEPSKFTTILKQFSFLATITMDYMIWEIDREYKSIEEKKSTDHEQLRRIRKLIMEAGRGFQLGADHGVQKMFGGIAKSKPQPDELGENGARTRRRKRRQARRKHGFSASSSSSSSNESEGEGRMDAPALIPPDIANRPQVVPVHSNPESKHLEASGFIGDETNKKDNDNNNNNDVEEFTFKKRKTSTWESKLYSLNAIWEVFHMYGLRKWLKRAIRRLYLRIRYQFHIFLRWLSRL